MCSIQVNNIVNRWGVFCAKLLKEISDEGVTARDKGFYLPSDDFGLI